MRNCHKDREEDGNRRFLVNEITYPVGGESCSDDSCHSHIPCGAAVEVGGISSSFTRDTSSSRSVTHTNLMMS